VTPDRYAAFLAAFMPSLTQEIMRRRDMSFRQALRALYTSPFYADLEDETTKLWRLSPLLLADLWEEEQNTGTYDYPEAL